MQHKIRSKGKYCGMQENLQLRELNLNNTRRTLQFYFQIAVHKGE